jgi:hypothetical protein
MPALYEHAVVVLALHWPVTAEMCPKHPAATGLSLHTAVCIHVAMMLLLAARPT